MKDVTLDLETCALCPTAAVMSIGAVAWDRNQVDTPFYEEGNVNNADYLYLRHIDLRSQFVNGFTFDQDTANWWASRSKEAKAAVTHKTANLAKALNM